MAACGIAAKGGDRRHGRHFPRVLCVPLHGQFLVAPMRKRGKGGVDQEKMTTIARSLQLANVLKLQMTQMAGRAPSAPPCGNAALAKKYMAERGGFEPPVPVIPVRRFSKPLPSATQPPLRKGRRIGQNTMRRTFWCGESYDLPRANATVFFESFHAILC